MTPDFCLTVRLEHRRISAIASVADIRQTSSHDEFQGDALAKGRTPIERAIAGEPLDRRQRYLQSLSGRGLTRVTVVVPTDEVDAIKRVAASLRAMARQAGGGDD